MNKLLFSFCAFGLMSASLLGVAAEDPVRDNSMKNSTGTSTERDTLDAMDINGDGKITDKERKIYQKRKSNYESEAKVDAHAKMDANGDGVITPEERKLYQDRHSDRDTKSSTDMKGMDSNSNDASQEEHKGKVIER
jgi:hypothetical protein